MLIRSIDLVEGYPTGRENRQRAWLSFNESTPGVLHRDPIWGDSRYPVVWARNRAEGSEQVIKLLVRSCRRWQLIFLQPVLRVVCSSACTSGFATRVESRSPPRGLQRGYLTASALARRYDGIPTL